MLTDLDVIPTPQVGPDHDPPLPDDQGAGKHSACIHQSQTLPTRPPLESFFLNTFIFLKNLYKLKIHPYNHRGVKDHILWCLKQI